MIRKFIRAYSHFVARHPFIILFFVSVFTVFMLMQGQPVTENQNNRDILPESLPVIHTFSRVEDEFGSVDTITLVVTVDPSYPGSEEVRDLRDPRAVKYMDNLAQYLEASHDIESAQSVADTIRMMHGGTIPQDTSVLREDSRDDAFSKYLNQDYTVGLVSVRLGDSYSSAQVYENVKEAMVAVERPAGVKVDATGEIIKDVVMEKTMADDMVNTAAFSLAAIVVLLLLIFRSFKFGLIPLTTIIFGNLWAFGMLAFLNQSMTTVMSGAASMIMGIGIDFGIQIISRYREEVKDKSGEHALALTLRRVLLPLSTTVLAAVIGFRAMSLGQLTIMADLGTMMTYGVVFCYVAAITVIPSLIMIFDRFNRWRMKT